MDMMLYTPWYVVDVGTDVVMLSYGSKRVRCFAGRLPTKPERLHKVTTQSADHWIQHIWT
jgi:hypothetical protein